LCRKRLNCLCFVGSVTTLFNTLHLPTRSGYAFDGWYTALTGGTSITTSTVFTGDTTIYAHWAAIYTITFNPNGGAVLTTSGQTETDGKLSSLPVPTRSGYTFNGWYTAQMGGARITTNTIFTSNATVYAHWTLITNPPIPTPVPTPVPTPTPTPTPIPANYFSGNNNTYEINSNTDLVFIVEKDFSLFKEVRVDGKLLTKGTHYKAESGSTIITLFANYLDTLTSANHKLRVC